jgi:N-acetylmuramidase-like protein/putative peptidoglycan binding protein
MPSNYVEANKLRVEAELRRKELELKHDELKLREREQELHFGKRLHLSPTVGGILVAFIAAVAGIGGHYWDWFTSRLSSADNIQIAKLNAQNAQLLEQLHANDAKRHDAVELYISMLTTIYRNGPPTPEVVTQFLDSAKKNGLISTDDITLASLGPLQRTATTTSVPVITSTSVSTSQAGCNDVLAPIAKDKIHLLSGADIKMIMDKYLIDFATLQTFLTVQASGIGFLPDGRPKILFERHIFHRLTNSKYDETNPDISAPTPGGYGGPGAHQYDRLIQAVNLDCDAALEATSWGITQIIGASFKAAGAKDIGEFVRGQINSEASQLNYGFNFLISSKILEALVQHKWDEFSKFYNGATFSARYNEIMAAYYARYSSNPSPSPEISQAKTQLANLGYYKGDHSEDWNMDFQFALRAFQWMYGLQPADGLTGPRTMAALAQASAK